jgi:hypothetical protein
MRFPAVDGVEEGEEGSDDPLGQEAKDVVVVTGKETLTVRAVNLMSQTALDPMDYVKHDIARNWHDKNGFVMESFSLAMPLRSVIVRIAPLTKEERTRFSNHIVIVVYVFNPADNIYRVQFNANREALEDQAGATDLAIRMARTLRIGSGIPASASWRKAADAAVFDAGALGQLPLSKETTPLLDDGLRMQFPAEVGGATPHAPISVDGGTNKHDAWRKIGLGSAGLTVSVTELNAFAGPNFEESVWRYIRQRWDGSALETATISTMPVAARLEAVAMRWPSIRPRDLPAYLSKGRYQQGKTLLVVYVRSADDTVQEMTFSANREALFDELAVFNLAARMAASVTAGPRHGRAGRSFDAELQDGFVKYVSSGLDSRVVHYDKPVLLGEPRQSCGIYEGFHPNFRVADADRQDDAVTPASGDVSGETVKWRTYEVTDGYKTEALFGAPHQMQSHVFCTASTLEDMEALRAAMESRIINEGSGD